jgi:hypothetical protein
MSGRMSRAQQRKCDNQVACLKRAASSEKVVSGRLVSSVLQPRRYVIRESLGARVGVWLGEKNKINKQKKKELAISKSMRKLKMKINNDPLGE